MYLCDYSAKMQIQVLMVWINNRNLNCQCNMFFQCLPITKRTSNRFLWSWDFWYPDNSTSSCIVSSCSIAEGSILGHKFLLSVLRIHHGLIQGWFYGDLDPKPSSVTPTSLGLQYPNDFPYISPPLGALGLCFTRPPSYTCFTLEPH
jgi:hypothetical protein